MRGWVTKGGLAGCAALAAAALLAAPALAAWGSRAPDGSGWRGRGAPYVLRAGFERGDGRQGGAPAFGFGRNGAVQGQEQGQNQGSQASQASAGNGRGSQGQGSQGSQSSQSPGQTTPGTAGSTVSAEGVVQSISPTAITVRQLDGSVVTVPLGHDTALLLDGRTARASQIRVGDVLVCSWTSGQPAATVHLYSAS